MRTLKNRTATQDAQTPNLDMYVGDGRLVS
jgi:hypothetical protein